MWLARERNDWEGRLMTVHCHQYKQGHLRAIAYIDLALMSSPANRQKVDRAATECRVAPVRKWRYWQNAPGPFAANELRYNNRRRRRAQQRLPECRRCSKSTGSNSKGHSRTTASFFMRHRRRCHPAAARYSGGLPARRRCVAVETEAHNCWHTTGRRSAAAAPRRAKR